MKCQGKSLFFTRKFLVWSIFLLISLHPMPWHFFRLRTKRKKYLVQLVVLITSSESSYSSYALEVNVCKEGGYMVHKNENNIWMDFSLHSPSTLTCFSVIYLPQFKEVSLYIFRSWDCLYVVFMFAYTHDIV
jgi:hypothetical protein